MQNVCPSGVRLKRFGKKSFRNFSAHGTTWNRNKGNSGRQRAGRPKANIEAVRGPNDLNDLQNRIQNEVDELRNDPAYQTHTSCN